MITISRDSLLLFEELLGQVSLQGNQKNFEKVAQRIVIAQKEIKEALAASAPAEETPAEGAQNE